MAFSLSGSTITQSGTDANLSGISGNGALATALGSGELAVSTYDMGVNFLNVTGGLTVDAHTETLYCENTASGIRISSGGALTVDGRYQLNGALGYTNRRWLSHGDVGNYTDEAIEVLSGGSLTLHGGEVFAPRGISFGGGSTIRINNAIIDSMEVNLAGADQSGEHQIRQSSGNCEIDGLTLYRGYFTILAVPSVFRGYKPRFCAFALAVSSTTPDVNITLSDFDTDGSNTRDVMLYAGSQYVLINPVLGPRLNVSRHPANVGYGLIRVIKTINHHLKTPAGADIDGGFALKLSDTDSSRRGAYNQERFSGASAYDGDQDFAYCAQQASGSATTNVLVSMHSANGNGSGTVNHADVQADYRFDEAATFDAANPFSETITPTMAFSYWALGKQSTTGSVALDGAGPAEASVALIPDELFTAADRAEVEAYTGDNTPERAYNAQCVWYEDELLSLESNTDAITLDNTGYDTPPAPNATAQSVISRIEALGGIGSMPVTYADGVLDAGSYDVDIDGAAADYFDFDGTTVTIKGPFDGAVVTTGTVALVNGGSITGSITDVSGKQIGISVAGGGTFSIVGHNISTDTAIAYSADIASLNLNVTPGENYRFAIWEEGKDPRVVNVTPAISTDSYLFEMVSNTNINTGLDVTSEIADIDTVVDASGITLRLGAMEPSFEEGKAIVHQLLKRENALRAMISANRGDVIVMDGVKFTINLPSFFVRKKAGLALSDTVKFNFFVDQTPALAINPAFVVNPFDTNGRVETDASPAALDPSTLAAAVVDALPESAGGATLTAADVWSYVTRELTSGGGGGGGATAQEVWEYATRELTTAAGLTAEQEAALTAARDHARAANRQTQGPA